MKIFAGLGWLIALMVFIVCFFIWPLKEIEPENLTLAILVGFLALAKVLNP